MTQTVNNDVTVQVGQRYLVGDIEVIVEDLDRVDNTVWVFDYNNYNGGWMKMKDLTPIETEDYTNEKSM